MCCKNERDCPNDSMRHMKREENYRVYVFPAGLNQVLDEVRGRILGRKPLRPSMREVFSEIRRELTQVHPRNRKLGLVSRGFDSHKDRRKKPWCEHCRKPRHTKETCWKIHGKPSNLKKKELMEERFTP
ncbi:UNVERIFIED_CONTAM: hypothetical protein Slati_3679400 [Sesamum latifolium]|uniref:Uncharacterized protein n=1 Tax=Sesamum latifolium TaxID=2727402 RepID=A0AAW2U2I4_9LAMI